MWLHLSTWGCAFLLTVVSSRSISTLFTIAHNVIPLWVLGTSHLNLLLSMPVPQSPLLHISIHFPDFLYFSPVSSHAWSCPHFPLTLLFPSHDTSSVYLLWLFCSPLLIRIETTTFWSFFFLSFLWSVSCIVGILNFWANNIHLSVGTYHVCSVVIGLHYSGWYLLILSICLRISWIHCF